MICKCCENKSCSVRDVKDCPRCGGNGVEPTHEKLIEKMVEETSMAREYCEGILKVNHWHYESAIIAFEAQYPDEEYTDEDDDAINCLIVNANS